MNTYPTRIDFAPWQVLHLCNVESNFACLRDPNTTPAQRTQQLDAMHAFYNSLTLQLRRHDPELYAQGLMTCIFIESGQYEMPPLATDLAFASIDLHRAEYEYALKSTRLGEPDGSPEAN